MPFRFAAQDNHAFQGDFEAANFLSTSVFSMATRDHTAERTAEHIRNEDEEYVVVTFQVGGMLKLTQQGKQVQLTPGQIGLYLSSKPAQLECYGNYQSRSVRIPVDRLNTRSIRWDQVGALSFDGSQGLAPPILSFLTGLFPAEPTLTPSARAAVANHLVGLVEAMLADLYLSEEESLQSPAADLLEQCLVFIEANLSNPQLNPQMVADSAHISIRYLHQTFKQSGITCASYIRSRRIDRVRADLALEEFAIMPVEKILQRWGVQNPSHFGQVFKRIEGCAPAEFRRKALIPRGALEIMSRNPGARTGGGSED
ncbi:Transcriptional activator FeaR [Corynebacterium comes]|uniref:Transcriptional activator FeaR n=2 Tax=Corynebacterium comes TaxID=2675218 RepID=A0A6B8VTM3_9CORY|nr:Transcriptional activator FeaR [Corynebacterium comes]